MGSKKEKGKMRERKKIFYILASFASNVGNCFWNTSRRSSRVF
jgi:hypothetical protein